MFFKNDTLAYQTENNDQDFFIYKQNTPWPIRLTYLIFHFKLILNFNFYYFQNFKAEKEKEIRKDTSLFSSKKLFKVKLLRKYKDLYRKISTN